MKSFLLRFLWVTLLPLVGSAEEQKGPIFFPPKTFDQPVAARYSGHLAAMKEDALPPLAKNKEAAVYRFTCLETFKHPFSIKVTKTEKGVHLRRVVLSGRGGYAPGEIKESVESELKPEAVAELEKLLQESKFKELEPAIKEDDEYCGTDGSRWMVESVRNGKYQVVDRWSPSKGDAMRKIGEWFHSAAQWQPDEAPAFFPPELDGFSAGISKHLTAVSEEVLPPLAGNKGTVAFRFTGLQEFRPSFSIEIKKTETGFQARRAVLSGRVGEGSGKIRESVESALKPEAVAGLEKLLVETKFKEMKAVPAEEDGVGSLGGTQWLVEVVRDGDYRVVTRWSPPEGSAMRKIGEAFFEAVKWEPEALPRYFSPETFDEFTANWYASQLALMKEEVLPSLAEKKEAVVYRFTCLPTFNHPFSIKITKQEKEFRLRRIVLSGKGGYDPGEIKESVDSDLKPETIAELEKLLAETKFKEMKTTEESGGLDGSEWLVEVVKDGKYQIVDRWTPDEGSSMRRIGEWFLKAAKWQPEELY